ncbi:UbiA prenyltransferase family [Lentinula edodes]|nr:UbiA prenyltransferase family [Lentinula edodes]
MFPQLDISQQIIYHAMTGYLFCKSDIMTTVLPVTILAFTATPLCTDHPISHAIQSIFWLLLHLLQFNLSNQLYSINEDRENHPYRPLASGRITISMAFNLRWLSTLICLFVSLFYGKVVLEASFFSALFALLYNETTFHKHWFYRCSFNALGYGAFKLGTMLISSCDNSVLDSVALDALSIGMAMIWTTVYVQDFQDVEGDTMMERATLPIVFPTLSRAAVMPMLLLWSIFLWNFWNLAFYAGTSIVLLAIAVSARFWLARNIKADKISYLWYNLWLAICFMLPAYYRVRSSIR